MRFSRPFLVVFAVAVLGLSVCAQTIQINRDNKTIAVTATDEATAVADVAAISVGFQVFAPDSDSAYAQGGKLSHAIMDALHNAGVKDEAIESAEQGLQRTQFFDDKTTPEERVKHAFEFHQSWTVTVPPKLAPDVIRDAVAAGANRAGSIDWRLSDRKALQSRAAANALVKARSIAESMAAGLQVKLGALMYASNEAPEARPLRLMAPSVRAAAPPPPPPTLEIRPQTVREEATVYAVFAIE